MNKIGQILKDNKENIYTTTVACFWLIILTDITSD
jgi:hypothetical protein